MNISEIKDLMAQFDQSSLKEFSYRNSTDELSFSKNTGQVAAPAVAPVQPTSVAVAQDVPVEVVEQASSIVSTDSATTSALVEGDIVESPLVGVAYLASGPDKPAFVTVGDTVKKGQTLLIIEAMKVMNEVPSPCDGVVTEILVANEEVVEFGKGLVRIK